MRSFDNPDTLRLESGHVVSCCRVPELVPLLSELVPLLSELVPLLSELIAIEMN